MRMSSFVRIGKSFFTCTAKLLNSILMSISNCFQFSSSKWERLQMEERILRRDSLVSWFGRKYGVVSLNLYLRGWLYTVFSFG